MSYIEAEPRGVRLARNMGGAEVLAGGERDLTLRSPSRAADRMLSVFGLSHLVSAAADARKAT